MVKKAKSTASRVDAAWRRVQRMHERFPFLPHDGCPDALDWGELRSTAAEMRANLRFEDVTQLRADYRTVMEGLGYLPPLYRKGGNAS